MTSLAEEIARRTAGSPVQLVAGQVVVDGVNVSVNVAGQTASLRWVGGWAPVHGDPVLVALQDKVAWVLGTVGPARPEAGTVQTVPGGSSTISVDVAGVLTSCRFVSTYTPTVGDSVLLSWQSTMPVVMGKIGATAAPVASAPPVAPPSGASQGQRTFPAVESRSYRSGEWRTDSDDVLQGTAPGYPGENFGAWFYGTAPASLAGATVRAARVWMRGRSSSVATPTVHVYRHTSSTRPGGDVARVAGPHDAARDDKAAGWVEIPAGYAQAVVDSGGGIAIAGSPYARIAGLSGDGQSGALQIDWVR